MEKKHLVLLLFLNCIFFLATEIGGQDSWFKNKSLQKKQTFIIDDFIYKMYCTATNHPDTVQLHLFIKISNASLHFIKEDTAYLAKYELMVNIHSDHNRYIAGKMRKGIVITKTFNQTVDQNIYTKETIRYPLVPGIYNLTIELLDIETKHRIQEKEKITLNNFFEHTLSNSELIFSNKQAQEKSADIVFPEFPPIRFQTDTSFAAYFQIYATEIPQKIQIEYNIYNYKKQPIYSHSEIKNVNSKITQLFIPLNQNLAFGRYTLALKINGSSRKIETENPFYVKWSAHSIYIHNLEQAVETLQYITKQSEWQHIKSLPQHEQIKTLHTFWKKRDPVPETDKNELEEEYYKRVYFTNIHFSNKIGEKEGWKTDRGKIYIIYGAPSQVEKIPFSSSQSGHYEVWYYSNLSKKFIFSDQSGTGNYQLISEE